MCSGSIWRESPSSPSLRGARAAPAAPGHFQPPNESLSPQGSVEAQCGLVLNGQGGVIRRGKAAHARRLFLHPRPRTHAGATRRDGELQADKQAEHSSVVSCQHAEAGADTLARTFS